MCRPYAAASIFLTLALLAASPRADAAEGSGQCMGFITSLPTVIDTAGVWCLNQNLSTTMSSGYAITINVDDVTIDCNHFELNGRAAGVATTAFGIYSANANETVRHCRVRGFITGVYFLSGGNPTHDTIEDNLFEDNTGEGFDVYGDGSVVRRNIVRNIGGTPISGDIYGIFLGGSIDVEDNTVTKITGSGAAGKATGIYLSNNAYGHVSGNRIRGLEPSGTGIAYGVFVDFHLTSRPSISDNDVTGSAFAGSVGLYSDPSNSGRCDADNNVINGFATGISGCQDSGGNIVVPRYLRWITPNMGKAYLAFLPRRLQ